MKRKMGVIGLAILIGISNLGCSNIKNYTVNKSEFKPEIVELTNTTDENTYVLDISLDSKEHTFKTEDMRPIIKAFIETNQALSPAEIEALFHEAGNVVTSEIYTVEPSVYELFDISTTNNTGEQVVVKFKDGRVISKIYKKDSSDNSNKNLAFVNYESNLFKTKYSSGIYDENMNNISENLDIWSLEEQLFNIFN